MSNNENLEKTLRENLKNKVILITGGTGSLGQALTERLLNYDIQAIRIFSRNESRQIEMESNFNDKRLRFLIGDIRDLHRLNKACEDVDIVFHAAALKHVPVVEYNPFEAINTNVIGSQNVIDACYHCDVKISVCVGTDKAVSPLNTYGATKLLMEKLFVAANPYWNPTKPRPKFIAVRYGNVLGSSGSVVPKFISQIKANKKITITDNEMTRLCLTMDEALDFILDSTFSGKSAEVFIPKLRAFTVRELKQALVELLNEDPGEEKISIRPGEKLHEILVSPDEVRYTWEYEGKYVIFNPLKEEKDIMESHPGIKKIQFEKAYSSDNVEKISVEELKQIITDANLIQA